MGPARGELEVLVPLSAGEVAGPASNSPPSGADGPEGARDGYPRPGYRTRRPVVVALVLVVAAVAVSFPIRGLVARHELRWLERQWAQSQVDDDARISAEHNLASFFPVTDPGPISAALAAVYREEQRRFEALGAQLRRSPLIDSGLNGLRSDVAHALGHRVSLLARLASFYDHPTAGSPPPSSDGQTAADKVVVSHDLAAARTRWGEHRPAPPGATAPYRAATAELARLAHWLDLPLGVALLAVSGQQLVRLDVDASRTIAIPGLTVDGNVISRLGYVAVSSGGHVWALEPDGSGPPRLLASGPSVFAAADPRAVWVTDPATRALTELDGSGHVLMGPITVPGEAIAATASGLVVVPPDQSAIEVWVFVDRKVRCRLGVRTPATVGTPYELAAQGDLLAWLDTSNRVHMTDTVSCADRPGLVPKGGTPLQSGPPVTAAFSPDGRTFAIAGSDQDRPGFDVYFLQVIDLATAQVTTVPVRAGFPISAVAWTADGKRLFWISAGPVGIAPAVSTWRIGDSRVQPFRIIGPGLVPPLVVVP